MSNDNIVRKINTRARMLEENRLRQAGEQKFGMVFWLSMGTVALWVIWGML